MSDNMKVWNALKTPPPEALKKIEGGRLKGMTDISPQWRYKAMTEEFGPCGMGWKYEVVRTWQEAGSDEQVFAFAEVRLFIRELILGQLVSSCEWYDPIPGIGGSMLIAKEKAGPHSSDEAYKMAITDALSVAMKMLGVGADVYMGMMGGNPADKQKDKKEPSGKNAEQNKEDGMRKKIKDVVHTIVEGDNEQKAGVLAEITKDKKGGSISTSAEIDALTGKTLGWCYAMAKTYLESWEAAHGPTEDDGSTMTTDSDGNTEFNW